MPSARTAIVGEEDDTKRLAALQPGQTLVYDYRRPELVNSEDRKRKLPDTFRVAQWNIERGARLEGIIKTLRACEADIVVLQELDINCRRSYYANVPRELAKALCMQCVFVCEFEELDAPERSLQNAVGPLSAPEANDSPRAQEQIGAGRPQGTRHFHGNAILSRCADLSDDIQVIRHSGDFDWEAHGTPLCEPRHGFRSALRVTVNPADRTLPTLPPVYIYCCHFEVFSGALTRVRQLADCLSDASAILEKENGVVSGKQLAAPGAATSGKTRRLPSFIIAGDLNTMAHNIVRFSGKYARDRLRFLSVGETEAMWLQRKVLSRNFAAIIKGCCPLSYRFPSYVLQRLYECLFDSYPVWRYVYGFSPEEIRAMDNTKTCFYDPSDKYNSITLDNPEYKGFVRGKLDWLLLSNLTVRPFRVSRGGARPVDVATLFELQSLETGSPSARYLQSIYAPDAKTQRRYPSDESREATEKDLHACTPRDGYVLLNERYWESDHKGLLITVKQSGVGSTPEQTYPPYGATYTSNPYALGAFLLSRAIPLAVVAAVALKVFRKDRS